MTKSNDIPEHVYGVLNQDRFESGQDEVAEQVRRLGYAILDSGYTSAQLREISDAFDRVRERYVNTWGETRLRSLNEFHTIRALMTHGGAPFMQLAMNSSLMAVLQKLIVVRSTVLIH